jgi:hypothetical protein
VLDLYQYDEEAANPPVTFRSSQTVCLCISISAVLAGAWLRTSSVMASVFLSMPLINQFRNELLNRVGTSSE